MRSKSKQIFWNILEFYFFGMEYQELFFSQTLYLDHSQGDLAKFGYGLDMKIKKFEESCHILATCLNLM